MMFNKAIGFFSLIGCSEAAFRPRKLSLDAIAGFEPKTPVYDHNNIAYDQEKIEDLLVSENPESYQHARDVYEKGSYSKSYAMLKVDGDLLMKVNKGTTIAAVTIEGDTIVGSSYDSYGAGTSFVGFQYTLPDHIDGTTNCNVGGNPDPATGGCLNATGTVIIDPVMSMDYEYNPLDENMNGRTIQGFSTNAARRFKPGDNVTANYFPDFQKFVDYYGQDDYANEWITAAFEGRPTSFASGLGNADMTKYDYEGLSQVIKKGTAYMSVAMYVIRELEDAIYDCEQNCQIDACNDDAVHALDEAVAFYTGALEGKDGSGDGNLMYALADKRCQNFKTCGADGNTVDGTSKVNKEIFDEFRRMQDDLVDKKCSEAEKHKERIVELMFIPLVQGTLRYAWKMANDNPPSEAARAEAAVFAASVLPVVHRCNPDDAEIVYSNLKVGSESADYGAVKAAFERSYGCMGITCADVGGYYNDVDGNYYSEADPCNDSDRSSAPGTLSTKMGTVFLVSALALGHMVMDW